MAVAMTTTSNNARREKTRFHVSKPLGHSTRWVSALESNFGVALTQKHEKSITSKNDSGDKHEF